MTLTEKVTSGNRKIVRLPSGDYVNISFASYMDVGQLCVKVYWLCGHSKIYQYDDATALIQAWEEVAGMKFVKPTPNEQVSD